MDARGDLAGGEEPLDRGRSRLGRNRDTAHRVMRRRRDVHRVARDVEQLMVEELLVHAGQPLADVVTPAVAHVEQDAPALRASAGQDLAVVRVGHAVPRGELEALRVVARHEALAERVPQDPALAADGLRYERARELLRPRHPRRVELHHLHVPQLAARAQREREAVAVVLVATGGAAPEDPRVATRGKDDRVGVDREPLSARDREAEGAEAPPLRGK